MNKPLIIGGSLAVIVAAVWYYRKRSAEIASGVENPNASVSPALGQQAGSYDRATGPFAETYTNNYRYDEYRQYLQQGGAQSGMSFDQFLTAAQGQSLPSS